MAAEKTWVEAAFDQPDELRQAVERLLAVGFSTRDLEVRSSVPLEENPLPGERLRSRAPLFAVLGGLLGGVIAFLVAVLTAKAYPLPTGGMPIVAPAPVGIVTYEGVALGAILATVLGVFLEGRWRRLEHRSGSLEPLLAEGKMLLGVRCEDGTASTSAKRELEGAVAVAEAGAGS